MLLDEPAFFAQPGAGDDELRNGVAANQGDDFSGAAAWFEASHRLHPRISTVLSIANMRLKLGDGPLAAYLYAAILEHPAASDTERAMAARKLPLAEVMLEELSADLQPRRPAASPSQGGGRWRRGGGGRGAAGGGAAPAASRVSSI